MSENLIEKSPQLFARLGGALYLFIIALGLYGEMFIRDRVITSGDAAVTAANLRAMESLWRLGLAAEFFLVTFSIGAGCYSVRAAEAGEPIRGVISVFV